MGATQTIVSAAAAASLLLFSSVAMAQAPAAQGSATAAPAAASPRTDGFHRSGFVYLAPGAIHIPIGDDDTVDVIDTGYLWGFGGGYLFTPGKHFMWSIGGQFEHAVANFDGCDIGDCDVRGDALRIGPEVRLGAGGRRLFAYGMVSPGVALRIIRLKDDNIGGITIDDDIDAGFNLGLAGGVQGIVWRNLAIGAEFGVDLGFMRDNDNDLGDDGYGLHTLDFKVLAAWYF